ncbi:hypothetical protein FHS18_002282 [Paenibacillus phyllosphaerae]|uniref:Uncharacterized protein n=1 Tax=Paenibacillus phyllosphaerae TaxID=274593 RepID=A0A7W5FMF4_9BACL|nr:hypothetical protein [Paenibacillus phyllosphaerae]MBB3110215.1 hypothetical protein [Paenibacillus phyllosphaerae]
MKKYLAAIALIVILIVVYLFGPELNKSVKQDVNGVSDVETEETIDGPTTPELGQPNAEETIKIGDKIGDGTVTSFHIEYIPESNEVFSLQVDLEGTLRVKGKYHYYPSDDEGYGDQILVNYERDPSFPGNYISDLFQTGHLDRKFILNVEYEWDKALFGKPGTEGEIEMKISSYSFKYYQSDEIDSADFVEIISINNGEKTIEDIDQSKIHWVEFKKGTNDATGKMIEGYYIDNLREVEGADATLDYSVAEEDLNGDSQPEIIAALHNQYFLGARCDSYIQVYPYASGKLGEPISITCVALMDGDNPTAFGVVKSQEHSWKDLVVNGQHIWTWNGKEYES